MHYNSNNKLSVLQLLGRGHPLLTETAASAAISAPQVSPVDSTCALAAAVLPLGGAEEPAVKVLLPELGEPDVPAVVLQGESGEVFIKP